MILEFANKGSVDSFRPNRLVPFREMSRRLDRFTDSVYKRLAVAFGKIFPGFPSTHRPRKAAGAAVRGSSVSQRADKWDEIPARIEDGDEISAELEKLGARKSRFGDNVFEPGFNNPGPISPSARAQMRRRRFAS